jgi:hypothetical protein
MPNHGNFDPVARSDCDRLLSAIDHSNHVRDRFALKRVAQAGAQPPILFDHHDPAWGALRRSAHGSELGVGFTGVRMGARLLP